MTEQVRKEKDHGQDEKWASASLKNLKNKGGLNMPKFDGTGPNGMGPMTGKGMGSCGGRFGRGRRFGFCRFRAVGFSKGEEKKMLEEEIKHAEEYLKELKKQLE